MNRDALRQNFLVQQNLGHLDCPLLAGDASFRKYYRLNHKGQNLVVMDAPPPQENVRPFIKIADFLESNGFSAPKILARDEEQGFLLLEDLGDQTYTRLLANGHDETRLYELATDTLIALHKKTIGLPENLPPYDVNLLTSEALLLPDWWMKAAMGDDLVTDPVRQSYIDAWSPALHALQSEPVRLVLRDYHVDNMLLLNERDGIQACGLLDFQDAVAGSGLYDLMSLLEDARRDIEPSLIESMKTRYLEAFPHLDRESFDAVFAILGAQRHAKVIGIFVRLCVRDGKDHYLHHIPRVWKLLERSLEHPALAGVKDWFDMYVAREIRGVPTCLQK